MTTLDSSKEKRKFFSIYKPTQGKWVRWGTVAGMTIIALSGLLWLVGRELAVHSNLVKSVTSVVWMGFFAWLTFWIVNTPKYAEFFIATESEMRKVTWPSRRDVVNATKVMIILTLLLGALLWIVDMGFVKLFQWVGVA